MPAEQRGPTGGIRSKKRGTSGMIKPTISLQELRAKIGCRAKSAPAHRLCKRMGFGWKRWSSEVVYGAWGLYDNYRLAYHVRAKVGGRPKGIITPTR